MSRFPAGLIDDSQGQGQNFRPTHAYVVGRRSGRRSSRRLGSEAPQPTRSAETAGIGIRNETTLSLSGSHFSPLLATFQTVLGSGPRRLQILNHPHNSAKVSLSYAALFTRALWNYPGYERSASSRQWPRRTQGTSIQARPLDGGSIGDQSLLRSI